jgi:hypothetical protein
MATIESNGRLNGSNHAAEQLLERLSEPHTLAALNQLLDHAELLAFSASSLDGFIRRGDLLADNVASSVADLRESLPPTKIPDLSQVGQLLQHLPQLTALTNQLADLSAKPEFQATLAILSTPTTLNSLNQLLSRMELLAFLVTASESLMQRGEEMTDNLRSSLDDLGSYAPVTTADVLGSFGALLTFLPYLPRLAAVAPKFIEVIEHLEPFIASPEFDALLSSGVFHADTVGLVGRAGDAFVESYTESRKNPQPVGILGLARALNDPDVQRAAGLIMKFAKKFGKTLA